MLITKTYVAKSMSKKGHNKITNQRTLKIITFIRKITGDIYFIYFIGDIK